MLYFWKRCLLLGVCCATLSQTACSQKVINMSQTDVQAVSPTDVALKHKFRGIRGGERRIDGLVVMRNVALRNEKGYLVQGGTFGPKGSSVSSYGSDDFVVPKTIRMMYYGANAKNGIFNELAPPSIEDIRPIADIKVTVAERIPDAILDEVRKNGGGFRLKLRLKEDDLLVGWDIESRPGYDPKKLESNGQPIYVTPVHSFVGGDFQEAKIYNGQVVRKGWYIDKKTGRKIETDF